MHLCSCNKNLRADELLPGARVIQLSPLPTIHRGDWYRQIDVNEHALQHHVRERRGEPLSEWRVPAAANIRPARE